MALEFGFYDSYNHDRVYNAENMNDIFEGVLTDGVYAGVGELFAVKPSYGLQVTVGTGRAWFKMTWNKNRTMAPVNLDQADPVYDRIDTVCIRVQKNILERRNDFFVYKGPILTEPQPPTLVETDDTFFLPLANVRVRANSEDIKATDIEMLVGRERCPFVTSILQQTDITSLFIQWQAQFEEWWDGVKTILEQVEQGDFGAILAQIALKVNISDKATAADVAYNSDSTWMTPARTKEMVNQIVDTGIKEAVGNIEAQLQSGVVNSFKGRKGTVTPQSGDYTAAQVGALSTTGGTLSGNLTVNGRTTTKGLTVDTESLSVTGESSFSKSSIFYENISVAGSSTLTGGVTMRNGLRLQSLTSNYGQAINFGDADKVHISEPSDDNMEIKANSVNLVLSGSATGASNTNFKINGVDPFAQIKGMIPTTSPGLTVTQLTTGSVSLNGEATFSVSNHSSRLKMLVATFNIITQGGQNFNKAITTIVPPYESRHNNRGNTFGIQNAPGYYNGTVVALGPILEFTWTYNSSGDIVCMIMQTNINTDTIWRVSSCGTFVLIYSLT